MPKIKNNMKKLSLLILGTGLLFSCNQEKTAYVNNTKLIQDYKGMKDTEAKFTKKSDKIKKLMDSMATGFQQKVQTYQATAESMSASARQEKENKLMDEQQQLRQQQQVVSNTLNDQSSKAIDSIVTVVKDFVADYGKENNYTYIFGSTESANIMYAKEGEDITEKIVTKLNAAYDGK